MRRAACVVLLVLGSCSSANSARSPETTGSTDTSTTVAQSTTAPPTTTVAAAPTTTASAGPLEFVDGRFLGIAYRTALPDAVAAIGVQPVLMSATEIDPAVIACTGTEDPWVIQAGGLTMFFEGFEGPDTAFLTNWMYTGGPVAGFTEMIGPGGVRVGDSRAELNAAHPDHFGSGDEIMAALLKFYLEDDAITAFGLVECVANDGNPDG